MNIVSIIVVFVISWWMVLFMVLPIGVHTSKNPEKGHADSAPEKPHIGKKFLATTMIAITITVLFYWVVSAGVIARPDRWSTF